MDGSPATGLLRRTGRTALRRLAAVLLSAAGMVAVMCTGTPPAAAAPVGITSAGPGPHGGTPGTVRYSWPLSPVPAVAAPFREPTHRFGPGHRGVDLAAAPGSAVIAAAAGTVVFAGLLAGRGVVSLQHAERRLDALPGSRAHMTEPVDDVRDRAW